MSLNKDGGSGDISLGGFLKSFRKANSLTQVQISEMYGIDLRLVKRIEQEKSAVRMTSNIIKLVMDLVKSDTSLMTGVKDKIDSPLDLSTRVREIEVILGINTEDNSTPLGKKKGGGFMGKR